MHPADVITYGDLKVDRYPMRRRDTDVGASQWNKLIESAAQQTRTSIKAIVTFTCTVPATGTLNQDWWTSQWGDSGNLTISKTGVGLYSVPFSASYVDGLGDSETVSLHSADAFASTDDDDDLVWARVAAVGTSSIDVRTFKFAAGVWALADSAPSAELIRVTVVAYE